LLAASSEDGFSPPSIAEFFPPKLFEFGPEFLGQPMFAMTRINIIMLIMTTILLVFFYFAFRKPAIVPSKIQSLGEIFLDFVRVHISEEILGHHAKRFNLLLTTMFFMIFAFSITGILPLMHIGATSVIAIPLILALASYAVFNYAGVKQHGLAGYLQMNLFPPGVPKPLYILVTPIEVVSTFIFRPATLTIRLVANMIAGHMLLVLFYSGANYLLLVSDSLILKPFGVFSFIAGFAFTLFEILVAFLQAYIFTLLTAVYISGAVSEEH
jgi:F-type H+-transporting ATPase subunit a